MTPPEKIYLQRHDNPNDAFDWTWCRCRIEDDDVEYALAPQERPLTALGSEAQRIGRSVGWDVVNRDDWDSDSRIPAYLIMIHAEISEALEGFRKDDRENVAEELADVLIRTVDLAYGLGIDLDHEVAQKMKKNAQRSHRHGGKRI